MKGGIGATLWGVIIIGYLLLGIVSVVIVVVKEPLIVHVWWAIPVVVLVFPYALWAVFTKDDTGRWV